MSLSALVMAGGKATRMGGRVEKPVLLVGGKTMLERVVETLRAAQVDRIVVATSVITPQTNDDARRLAVETLSTPGNGFEEDMKFAIRNLKLEDVLVVSADLPLITPSIIRETIQRYHESGKPALAVMAKVDDYERLGIKPQYVFETKGEKVAAVGINMIDGRRIDEGELDQEVLMVDSLDLMLNVNNAQELELARKRLTVLGQGIPDGN
ncbi:MAG TPA: NTP transferase domain-containing protein [Terriglobales bacterium]|nr:NTP transferase domain-containing protein [Terriglobales bacterium]